MSIYGPVFHGAVIARFSCSAAGAWSCFGVVNDGTDGHLSTSQLKKKQTCRTRKKRLGRGRGKENKMYSDYLVVILFCI